MAHTEIIGSHGTGKSTLLKRLAIKEIKNGSAVVFIDCGNELDEVMTNTPRKRLKDTVLFDPTFPLAWNFLADNDNIPLVASTVADTLRGAWRIKIIPPNIEATVESLIYTALTFDLTLLDCLFLLKDKDKIKDTNNPVLDDFWTRYFKKSDKDQDLVAWSTYTKLYKLLLDPQMQLLFGQRKGTLSVPETIKDKLLFVRLPLSFWGDSKVSLIGSVLLAQIYLASLERDASTPLYIFIEDVHRYAPTIVAKMLDTLGKQNVHIIVTHRNVEQVDPDLFASMQGNCEKKFAFRVSPEDTDALMRNQIINSSWRLENLRHFEYRELPWQPVKREHKVAPLPFKENKMIERIEKHTRRNYCK